MITKNKSTRFVFALLLALSAIGISTLAALADRPVKSEYTETGDAVLTDVCSFPVGVSWIVNATEIDFLDTSGAVTAVTKVYLHRVEQDTFTANGKMLVGLPFTFNLEILFDSSGNPTHGYADGITEKIPLPDGSLFISAGRLDFAAHPGATFILSPDKGNPGNVAGFCAALAP